MNMSQHFVAFALSSGAALALCVGLPNVLVHSAHARLPGKSAVVAAGEPLFLVCRGRPAWDWPGAAATIAAYRVRNADQASEQMSLKAGGVADNRGGSETFCAGPAILGEPA